MYGKDENLQFLMSDLCEFFMDYWQNLSIVKGFIAESFLDENQSGFRPLRGCQIKSHETKDREVSWR